jgi:hypothetical protein
MKLKHLVLSLLMIISLAAFSACSHEKTTPYFQNNTGPTGPEGGDDPFNGLPDFGDPVTSEEVVAVLGELFNPGTFNLAIDAPDYQTFVDSVSTIKDNYTDETKDVLLRAAEIEDIPEAYTMMSVLRDILGYVIYQDYYDTEPAGDYWTGVAGYLNRINDANTGLKDDVYNLTYKMLSYFSYPDGPDGNPATTADNGYTGNLEQSIADFRDFLTDTDDPQVKNLLFDLEAGLGRLLMRSNDYIVHDCGNGDNNTYLGNAVAGVDLTLDGVNQIVNTDAAAKNALYDVIRETGRLLTATSAGGDFATVFKRLLMNIEDYYTQGGANVNASYYNVSSWPYINSELRNTTRELFPNIVKLLIRNDQSTDGAVDDYSIINNADGRSPLEDLTVKLDRLKTDGIDYSTYGLEASLKTMSQLDRSGRARGTESNLSLLDHLMFTVANAYYFGFLTWKDGNGDANFDNEPETNYNRRHGKATGGIMTINDSLYSMTTGAPLGYNAYSLALDSRLTQGDNLFRSSDSFTIANRNNYKFFFGYDYPAMLLLPANCAGDVGIPNGGGPAVTVDSNLTDETMTGGTNDCRTYWPKVADGKGILNTAHFLMTWIVRACWDGQGPYYSTQEVSVNASEYTYYRPNGKIYARVTKTDPADPGTWSYSYPVMTGDANDGGQRANRYRDTFRSDYFLAHAQIDALPAGAPDGVPDTDTYGAPPMNPSGSALAEGATGADKYKLLASAAGPSYFQFYEKIRETGTVEGDATKSVRECATQEEALYRNLQWLLLEKKFSFVIPMYFVPIGLRTYVFVVIEANGVLGLINSKKGPGNGRWLIDTGNGGEGTYSQTNGTLANSPDYHDSHEPGDARVMVFGLVNGVETFTLSPDVIFGGGGPAMLPATLGPGNAVPGITGANIDPFLQLGFLGYDSANAKKWCMTASGDRTAAWDSAYVNRNKLFPLLTALTAGLYEGTKYDRTGESGYNYNYTGTHKYPIADMLEGVMIPMSKPFMRLFSTVKGTRWVPQCKTSGADGDYAYLGAMRADSVYLPNDALRSLLSLLTGNSAAATDGILPMLLDTQMASKLLGVLTSAGASAHAADRTKLFQGLEQIVTSIQMTRGSGLYPDATCLDYTKYGWMFPPLRDGKSAGNPISLYLDTALDDVIGGDSITKGLATFVDNRGAGWDTAGDNYTTVIRMAGTLMGDTASPYYMTEDVISIVDSFLTGTTTTAADLKALRHTLGVLFARHYGTAWGTDTKLRDLLTVYLPAVLSIVPLDADPPEHGLNLMIVLRGLFDYDDDGIVEADTVDYVSDLMKLGDTPEDVILNLFDLMNSQSMWDSSYYSPSYPNRATLHELADILRDIASDI